MPYLRPKITPAKKYQCFEITIGTEENGGSGITGTNPKIAIIAVIKAVYTNCFVVIFTSFRIS